ncbi:MAG TPA: DUF2911 domain-containing protein [Bryobacteraceae bacterium]|jgi:hypothetical protein|nr:DUF2911 domain-containing protein [Bryobacteraceae bacterium]
MNRSLILALLLAAAAGAVFAQASPPAQTSVTINGKKLTIAYSAPSVHGRKIFGPGGLISRDPTYPVWRAGANDATAFHTDADLDVNGLAVPKGDYTLWVLADTNQWKLVINKQTGQWGLDYSQNRDLGRVAMNMSKPPAPVEAMKFTLTSEGGNRGKLQLAWENVVASVPLTLK